MEAIIVCRTADDGGEVYPGSVTGQQCFICHVELQITPYGQQRAAMLEEQGHHVVRLCNECGAKAAEVLNGNLAGVEIGPAVLEKLAAGGKQ